MARFGDPAHHAHMLNGIKQAIASPNTPAHLKQHLVKRLSGATTMPKKPMPMMSGLSDPMAPNGPMPKKPMFPPKGKKVMPKKKATKSALPKAFFGGM